MKALLESAATNKKTSDLFSGLVSPPDERSHATVAAARARLALFDINNFKKFLLLQLSHITYFTH